LARTPKARRHLIASAITRSTHAGQTIASAPQGRRNAAGIRVKPQCDLRTGHGDTLRAMNALRAVLGVAAIATSATWIVAGSAWAGIVFLVVFTTACAIGAAAMIGRALLTP